MYKLCKRILDDENIPESFKLTTLYMIWKHKFPANLLKNNRFIHLKQVLPRTVEAIVVNKMKDTLIKASSIYQIGGLPGHSIDEHLFVIKSIIALKEKKGRGVIVTLVDIVSFFDIYDKIYTIVLKLWNTLE